MSTLKYTSNLVTYCFSSVQEYSRAESNTVHVDNRSLHQQLVEVKLSGLFHSSSLPLKQLLIMLICKLGAGLLE